MVLGAHELMESTAATASAGALRDLLEFQAQSKVDRDARTGEIVIRRVKFLGNRSVNINPDGTRNVYPLSTRKKAESLYEGIPVYLNHPDRRTPGVERGYHEKLGDLRKVEALEDGSYADLHLNPKHSLAEAIAWDAEHAPRRLGLSHNAQGQSRIQGQDCLVEEIVRARSVDLVSSAATTQGLFESRQEEPTVKIDREKLKQLREADLTGVLDALQGEGTEAEKVGKVLEILKALSEKPAPAPTATTESQREPLVTVINAPAPASGELQESETVKALKRELDQVKAEQAATKRRAKRDEQLRESQLPKDALTEVFLEDVYAADDAKAVRLIEDRKKVFFTRTPVSGAPGGSGGREIKNVGAFVREED